MKSLKVVHLGFVVALFVIMLPGCDSSAPKGSSPADSKSAGSTLSANAVEAPADPISIEEFFKEKAIDKHTGKRVTWKFVIESVGMFYEHTGFAAEGVPVEFEGLKEPPEDNEHLSEYSKKLSEYSQRNIERVTQTVQLTFDSEERASYEKLKDAKGKCATISGIVEPSPINGSADLKHARFVSLDN